MTDLFCNALADGRPPAPQGLDTRAEYTCPTRSVVIGDPDHANAVGLQNADDGFALAVWPNVGAPQAVHGAAAR